MYVNFSNHGYERLGRVSRWLDMGAVVRAVNAAHDKLGGLPVGETGIKVKCLDKPVCVTTPDGASSSGDTIYVVFSRHTPRDEGCVATIELRFARQGASKRWCKVVSLCG